MITRFGENHCCTSQSDSAKNKSKLDVHFDGKQWLKQTCKLYMDAFKLQMCTAHDL